MKLLGMVAMVIACGTATTKVQVRNPKLDDFAAELSRASRRHDVSAARALLQDSVTIGGLWFSDVDCMKQFAFPGSVQGSRLDALARCVTALDLVPSARTNALPDVAILTYGPRSIIASTRTARCFA